ncbi:putative endo-polygalacturonase [Helianthus annuus]|uniref:Polygalacturonase n=1 Tax=Helianthus annuus TaxID=4232 RepID=A0A9K3J3J7_HELAN|nr:putative polygalacturonase [Helianthus annuus]KAJ0579489.1 putative endo-polygalacturonase [Helianthus annuus]KAJ0586680.1 putative endo-polygalacturonase [Helianthus annuus]KAJ0595388.1 putative endo-polygalacturonase [Helianthus annuus]KAJ0756059.1 putative endo-polygalacturonase [Helianthus annuus]
MCRTIMESPCISKHNSSLLVLMMLLSFMVGWIEGVCMEDERKALLEIKASLREIPYFSKSDFLGLSTWVGNGTSGECCDWERITCDPTTGYITDLYLSDITSMEYDDYSYYVRAQTERTWSLNFSSFAHFKELRSLDLSWNYINNTKGLERLESLKKLEILNLSTNYIETNIFPSLGALTSLKILDLSLMNWGRQFPPALDISEFSSLENLELLDLSGCGYNGSFQRQAVDGCSNDEI